MTQDPYAPPQADLRKGDDAPPPKPRSVVISVRLLWVSFVLSFPSTYLAAVEDPQLEFDGVFAAVVALLFVGWAFLIVRVSGGRNWARITMLVLVVLGLLSLLIPDEFSPSVLLRSLDAVVIALEVAAMFLLFLKPGSLWFKWR